MGQIYIPVEKKLKGPWFLGSKELEELGGILEFIEIELSKSLQIEIDEEANINVDTGRDEDFKKAVVRLKGRSRSEKKISLISKDEKKLYDSTIDGILKDPLLKDFSPKEIRADIGKGYDNEFSLIIQNRFDGELSYKATCSNQSSLEEIRYKIENWIEKYKPNKFVQIWNQFAFFIGLIGVLLLWSPMFLKNSEPPKWKISYNQEVDSILKTGITTDNQTKAIELLLKKSMEKSSDEEDVKFLSKNDVIKLLIIGSFLIIIAFFYPKTVSSPIIRPA